MRNLCGALAVLLGVTAPGCDRRSAEPRDAERGSNAPARVTAVDGMCAEHGVLEAICTKCNPKLIPVFQAKGDWCAEHGLPESVCPICHPEKGGKPAQDVSEDAAPADGLRVRLKDKDIAGQAGIETAKVQKGTNATAIAAPVRISYDATRHARVNARAAGVVRSLNVDIGSVVKKGAALLSIDSAAVGADRARLVAAGARVRVAEEGFLRESQLVREGVSSRATLLQAQQELDAAKSEEAALRAALSVLGAGGPGAGVYTLSSPLAGTVTERNVNIGRYVDSDDMLLEIVDTSEVWAEAEVAEQDLSDTRTGQTVTLTFDSLPGRSFTGIVTYVAPAVDPHTRTAKVRIPLNNGDGALRANLYGEARVAAGEVRSRLVVPRAAVQRVKDVALVFVKMGPSDYETRRVELGAADEGTVEIRKGLRAGEEVVTTGSFLLKTETLKDSIGAGCCEGP